MRRSSFLFVGMCTLAVGLVPVPAGAQTAPAAKPNAATVTIGPGLFSLSELAQTLSMSDAPLRASAKVAGRIGFVHLRDRSRADARRLIAAGFALAETPADKGAKGTVWTDEPGVKRREEAWRDSFTRYLVSEATQDAQDWAALAPLDDSALREEYTRRHKAERAQAERGKLPSGAYTYDGKRDFGRASRATLRAYVAITNRDTYLPRMPAMQNIPFAALVPAAMQQGSSSGLLTFSDQGAARQSRENVRFYLTTSGYGLETRPHDLGSPSVNVYGQLSGLGFWGIGETAARDPLLGRRATAWMKKEQADSEPFLSSPDANTPLTLDPALPSDTVGARLWQWCVARKQEAISEVLPALDATESREQTLAGVLRRWDSWSAREVDGVCVVTSRLRFLARARGNWESDALLVWVRDVMGQARKTQAANFFPFGDRDLLTEPVPLSRALAYSRAAWRDGQYTSWYHAGIGGSYDAFWHTDKRVLDSAALIGALWDMLPAEDRSNPDKRRKIPLNRLGSKAVTLVQQWCQATGTLDAGEPSFRDVVERKTSVVLEPAERAHPSCIRVQLDFGPPRPFSVPQSNLHPSLTLVTDR